MRREGVFLAVIGAALLMVCELGAHAGLWSNAVAVLLGILGSLLGFIGLARAIRAKQAEATAKAKAQAAASAEAAAKKRKEIEDILKKY